MAFWGKLFGSEKALNSVVKSVSSGLDSLYYSPEEKAQDAAKARTEARTMVIKWMESTQGQNLARRLIAVMVTFVWLLQYLSAQVLAIVAVWADDPDKWRQSAIIIGDYAVQMDGAMMLILAFYFAAPHMGQIVSVALNKFGKVKNEQVKPTP